MKPCSLAVLAAILLVAPAAPAAAGTLEAAIGSCAAQTDATLRLACYDDLAAQVKAAAVQAPAQVAAKPAAAAPKEESAWYDVGSWFGSRSSAPAGTQETAADFGAERLSSPPPAAKPAAAPPPPPPVAAAPVAPPPVAAPVQTAKNDRKQQDNFGGEFSSPVPKVPSQQTTPADFGSENLPAPLPAPGEAAAPKALDEITAEVADVAFNMRGRFIVTLDNDQMWQQLNSDSGMAHFSRNRTVKVTISRGLLGSYNLVIDGRSGLFKVKRIK